MGEASATSGTLRRRVVVGAIIAVVAIALAVMLAAGNGGNTVGVLADDARFLNAGAQVRVAGTPVGQVTQAEPTADGRARLELRIDEDDAWPLREGTQARFRWASTIAFSNRYVDLVPPQRGGPPIEGGGTIPAADSTSAVELDEIFNEFGPRTRRDLKATIDNGGAALGDAGEPLRAALDAAPSAVEQADAVLSDLGADEAALDRLVEATGTVAHAVESSDPDVGRLVAGAATTFDAVGGRARELQLLLERMPGTLDDARRTLAATDDTLGDADDVTRRLAPGVREVRGLLPPLNRTLQTVVDIGPNAKSTLRTLRTATPDLDPLLAKATQVMPRIRSTAVQADEQVGCVRPFAPEIAAFGSTWTGFSSTGDGKDKFFRTNATTYPFESAMPLNSAQIARLFPGLDYAFPRPPGQTSGQPWFQPQCKLGPETLDPAQDPETVG